MYVQDSTLNHLEAILTDAVVRKIDLHLISSLFLLFIFNILDRSNIANARLGGLQEDLNLSDTQYQTAVAIMVDLFPSHFPITSTDRTSSSAISSAKSPVTSSSPESNLPSTSLAPSSSGAASPSAWQQRRTLQGLSVCGCFSDSPSRRSSLVRCMDPPASRTIS